MSIFNTFHLFTGFHHPITSSNAAAGLVTLTPVNFALPNSSHFNSMSPLDIQPFQHQPSLVTVTNPQSIYKLMAQRKQIIKALSYFCSFKRFFHLHQNNYFLGCHKFLRKQNQIFSEAYILSVAQIFKETRFTYL